jgi:hypothetical protein
MEARRRPSVEGRLPSAAWKATLKVNCPYCGEVHEISVRETYINGALSDATEWMRRVS